MLKLCLILSHGNARLESGFSINSEIIENNLKESSRVLQRMVYEGIMKKGGIMKVDISNEMTDYVGRSLHINSIKRHKGRTKKTKHLLKRNAWKKKVK